MAVNLYSFSTIQLEQLCSTSGLSMGYATGFFCKRGSRKFLVTNHHVVSGYKPGTKEIVHKSCALPGTLTGDYQLTKFGENKTIHYYDRKLNINLFDENYKPIWLEHPTLKNACDVVAIPVDFDENESRTLQCIDLDKEQKRNRTVLVMDQLFVIGFPMVKEATYSRYPIYKSGYVASEPDDNQNGFMYYVDSKTRSGMSGSPIVKLSRIEVTNSGDGKIKTTTDATYFVGVYSGRAYSGDDAYTAELGIVWPYEQFLLPIIGN